ncbi:hypothetical protein T440DRAFT_531233, partial [Plenodomus tracheiphilus IPT5]
RWPWLAHIAHGLVSTAGPPLGHRWAAPEPDPLLLLLLLLLQTSASCEHPRLATRAAYRGQSCPELAMGCRASRALHSLPTSHKCRRLLIEQGERVSRSVSNH